MLVDYFGVVGGGAGGCESLPVWLSGEKVLSRNSSRTPALTGSNANLCKSARFGWSKDFRKTRRHP